MAVYFLDNNQQVIKIVPDNGAISILQTQELPEDNSLLKDLLSVHLKNDERLFDAQYMAIKSYDGNRNAFDMYRIVSEVVPDNATEFEGVQIAPYELEGVVVEDIRPQGWTIERTTNQILKDSDWRLGYVDDNLPTATTNFYYLSAKDSLKKLQELTGVEFTFKVEISGNKITDKWVEVYRELGNRTLKRFNYGTNALTVKRETNHSELYTALIGRGKGEEVGETDAGDATYGRKINFADVEWKKSAGNPVDKPKGQKYIELPQATAEFGVKMLDGRKVPRIGLVEFSDTEDPEVLIEQTWQALQEYARPKVLFSATVANIGDTGIGDTVTIHRHDLNMHYKTRVRKVMRNRKNNDKTQVEIGDVVYTASTKQQANINSQLNNMQNDLSNVKGEVSHVVTSADGKNNITYSNIEPERKKVGDSWVRDHPSLAGETQWLVWNGEAWELILDTSETTLNKEAIDQAQADIAEAQATAGNAITEISIAIDAAGFDTLADSLTGIQSISQTAQANSIEALGTAQDSMNTAMSALNNVTEAITEIENIDIRVDEVEGSLSIKADKQVVDALAGVVDTHTTDIQANAQGLALKANQSTVDTLAGTVQSLGTEFDIVAGKVNSRVWMADIDELSYENRNLLLDSAPNITSNAYLIKTFSLAEKPGVGERYTLRIRGNLGVGKTSFTAYNSGGNVSLVTLMDKGGGYYEGSFLWRNQVGSNSADDTDVHIYTFSRDVTVASTIEWIKLEKGTKATPYSPAPEDTDAKIDYIETEWTQTFDEFSQNVSHIDGRVTAQQQTIDSISSTVADNTGRISTTEQTIDGLQDTVYDPETGLTSVNTQLANLVDIAVTGNELSGALSVLEDNLNLRLVAKDEVITQINLSDENILIQSNKILLDGDVTVSGTAWLPGAVITSLTADKITTGTLNAANVRIINLDFDTAVGNRTDFVQSNWNSAVGGGVSINGSGIEAVGENNGTIRINRGLVNIYDHLDNYKGNIGASYHLSGSTMYRGIAINLEYNNPFAIVRSSDSSNDINDRILYIPPLNNEIHLYGSLVFPATRSLYSNGKETFRFHENSTSVYKDFNMGSNEINNVNRLLFPDGTARIASSGSNIHMGVSTSYALRFGTYSGESFSLKMSVVSGGVRLESVLNANSQIINNLSRLEFGTGGRLAQSSSNLHIGANDELRLGRYSGDTFTPRMIITSGGARMAGTLNMDGNSIINSPSISDVRLKDIYGLRDENDLEKLMQIEYVNFRWKNEEHGGDDLGFVAQQVQSIVPEIMMETADGMLGYNQQTYLNFVGHSVQQLARREENTNKVASQALQLGESNEQKIKRLEKRIEELESAA